MTTHEFQWWFYPCLFILASSHTVENFAFETLLTLLFPSLFCYYLRCSFSPWCSFKYLLWLDNQPVSQCGNILFGCKCSFYHAQHCCPFYHYRVVAIKEAEGFWGHLGIFMPVQDCSLQYAWLLSCCEMSMWWNVFGWLFFPNSSQLCIFPIATGLKSPFCFFFHHFLVMAMHSL